jgi:uncharacterized membrane protein YjdF
MNVLVIMLIIYSTKDKYKTTFVKHWGMFIWVVMPFIVKNAIFTYQKVVSKTLRENLNKFMTMFLNDFTIYNDMDNH